MAQIYHGKMTILEAGRRALARAWRRDLERQIANIKKPKSHLLKSVLA
jgi:hypothetical protein